MGVQPELVTSAPWPGYRYARAPRNVYWETTTACDLACRHCRADAIPFRHPDELTRDEALAFLRDVRDMGSMLVMTGGDPMKRPDLFELIAYGREMGIPIAVTPSTTPTLTRDVVERFRALGVAALGISLDGPTPDVHDTFRGVHGTFERSMAALGWAAEFRLPVQVNTTITADTIRHLPALYDLLRTRAAPPVRRWSLFLLVPTGRGTHLRAPDADEVEGMFAWVFGISGEAPFHVSTVEAPHYRRYWIQRQLADGTTPDDLQRLAGRMGFGVRDGNGVIFVSHTGDVFPAGFLPAPNLGNVRERALSEIYRTHPDLIALRDADRYRGRCGTCDFRWACGGSRARAYAMTGDLLGTDPLCAWEP